MSLDLSALASQPRLLLEVPLKPLQGSRFQPTGFPDLGAATYSGIRRNKDGDAEEVSQLLVESAQSMANRLEEVCWDQNADDGKGAYCVPIQTLPFVRATLPDGRIVTSVTESHRLNSPYFQANLFQKELCTAVKYEKGKPWRMQNLARFLLSHDPGSLIHGIFFSSIQDGRMRLPRALSAFIEAELPNRGNGRVESGFARREDSDPSGEAGAQVLDSIPKSVFEAIGIESKKVETYRGKLKDNVKNIIGPRTEFTGEITAFFNLDLAQLRGYGLPKEAETLLIVLSLFKIQKFLRDGLRLRTACDLEPAGATVIKRPEGFKVPNLDVLEKELPALIKAASKNFADPIVTEVKYTKV